MLTRTQFMLGLDYATHDISGFFKVFQRKICVSQKRLFVPVTVDISIGEAIDIFRHPLIAREYQLTRNFSGCTALEMVDLSIVDSAVTKFNIHNIYFRIRPNCRKDKWHIRLHRP